MATEVGTAVEIDDSDAAVRAFVAWADPKDQIKVLFGPDVLMAFESPTRRGWIMDEVYFVTGWFQRGCDDFVDLLADARHHVLPSGREPDPEGFMQMILKKGYPIEEVRHLI